jgi:hypothetical protein
MSGRILAVAALVASLSVQQALAQAKPNFAGTWKINTEKSDPMGGGMGGGGGGGGGGGMGGMMAAPITITQTDKQLVETRTTPNGDRVTTYNLDGTESVNSTGRGESKSKARWEGDALIIETTSTFNGPNGSMTITSKEVRTLSADGKTMTITITRTTPNGEMTTKRVYDKQ